MHFSKSSLDTLLAEHLLALNFLSEKELSKAQQLCSESNASLHNGLTHLNLLGEDTIFSALSEALEVPLIDEIDKLPAPHQIIETTTKNNLNVEWCNDNSVFPLLVAGKCKLYTSDPWNIFALNTINSIFSVYDLVMLTPSMGAAMSDELNSELAVSELFRQNSSDLSTLAEEAPVINLVNSILEKAVHADSSDIHIEAGKQKMSVRFRIDGRMHEYVQQPAARFPAIASRIKLLSQLDIAERRLPQDGRFTFKISGKEFDVRVSTAPDVNGESIVMRLLPKQRDNLSLENLGLERDHLQQIQDWGKLTNGILLVTGPTGSGKSTTLYSLLSLLNTGKEKIVTVEDPVEYQLPGITQVQANPEIGYDFAKALRSFLRQDPDIIMVGEIRDKETAEIAIQSSLTGHLVLSTLHTNDASSVFSRLIDIGVEPYLLAATIQGVQAQRLLRKLCNHCSVEAPAPTFITKENYGHHNWRAPKGCEKCQGKGYKGRIGVYEMIPMVPELRQQVVEADGEAEFRKIARQAGYRSLFEDGLIKASKGITSVEEVIRVCRLEETES